MARRPRNKGAKGRIYLKQYSNAQVNTGHMPPRTDDVFAYRSRARAIDDNIAKLLGLDIETENEPRRKALARIKEWSSMMEDCSDLSKLQNNHILMDHGRLFKLFLFWNKALSTYFFVEVRLSQPLMLRRSLGIHSRTYAQSVFEQKRISWYEWEEFNPSP